MDATFKAPAAPLGVALAALPAVVALPLAFGPEGVAVADADPVIDVVVKVELALEVELVLAVPLERMAHILAGMVEKAIQILRLARAHHTLYRLCGNLGRGKKGGGVKR